jgi:hypothetical protein
MNPKRAQLKRKYKTLFDRLSKLLFEAVLVNLFRTLR